MRADVFHPGEIAAQERAGERAIALRHGRMLADEIMAPALPWLAQQRLVAVAAADDDGRSWASVWLGPPGFVTSRDARTLVIAVERDRAAADDPVVAVLAPGSRLGVLAIELRTRRRLRINGRVASLTDDAIMLAVDEVFPNCTKYIHKRERVEPRGDAPREAGTDRGVALDTRRQALIARTDTLFVASRHPERGADASHRGGESGFVHVLDDHTIRIPDYAGNSMFQTLGNFAVDPHAGVACVDFEQGRILSMTGTASVMHGAEVPGSPTGGTGRYWTLDVERWIDRPMPGSHRWTLLERSPLTPKPEER